MTMDSTFEIPAHAVGRWVGKDMVILDLAQGRYLTLDPVGGRIWELLGEGMNLAELCSAMESEYDVVRDALEMDVRVFVRELSAQRLLAERD